MSKKSRLPIPIVNSRYLPTIGRLIGKTDGHLNCFRLSSKDSKYADTGSDIFNTDSEIHSVLLTGQRK